MVDPEQKKSFFDTATPEWYARMAKLEDGCDVSAGGFDIAELLIDSERVEE